MCEYCRFNWIPVKKKFPRDSGNYIVSIRNSNEDERDEYIGMVYFGEYGNIFDVEPGEEVVAWMLLPESYKGE